MTDGFRTVAPKVTALVVSALFLCLWSPAQAESLAGTYRGFLAFEFEGEDLREWTMMTFNEDGTLIMGAEHGHDEPIDPKTGLVTRNDFESANLGLWRAVGSEALEFGSQQYRAGSGFCGPLSQHDGSVLPTCSFIFTARLEKGATVRGEVCDLGGVDGGFAAQSVDGTVTEANPFGPPFKIDYCLYRMSVDDFLKLAPLE